MAKRRRGKKTGKAKRAPQTKPAERTIPARQRVAGGPAAKGTGRRRAPVRKARSAKSRRDEESMTGKAVVAGATNATDARPSFQEFFQQVADGVVKAQRSLDTVSAGYLADARRQPHVLPSVFRIPKVSAEAKFALESTDGKTVNLVFFKKTEEATTRHQQTVQFDVMAVPPPPELYALPFQVPLVVDAALRAAVLGGVTEPDWPNADGVVILHLSQDDYLLAYAGSNAGQIAVRHVHLAPGAGPVQAMLRPLDAAPVPPLWDTLTALGAAQRDFLARR